MSKKMIKNCFEFKYSKRKINTKDKSYIKNLFFSNKYNIIYFLTIYIITFLLVKEIIEEIIEKENLFILEKKYCEKKYQENFCEEYFYIPKLRDFCFEMDLCRKFHYFSYSLTFVKDIIHGINDFLLSFFSFEKLKNILFSSFWSFMKLALIK